MRPNAAWIVACLVPCIVPVVVPCLLASSANAQAACHAENDGPNFNDGPAVGGSMIAVRFDAGASFNAFRVEVWTGEGSGTHEVGLWAHEPTADSPWYELAHGTFQVAFANSWQGAALSGNVPLVAGTTYWVTWQPTAGSQMSIDLPGATPAQIYRSSSDHGQSWGEALQFASRPWKFRVQGDCPSVPIVYCTAGTTTHGCTASIVALHQPSLGSTGPCNVYLGGTEGQRTTVIFYSLASYPQPWCPQVGGTSYLCVKPPLMRTVTGHSGGTLNACDGALALDWNLFQLQTHETLGKPWSAGDRAYLQGWFRDPQSCKGTSTSDALELMYLP